MNVAIARWRDDSPTTCVASYHQEASACSQCDVSGRRVLMRAIVSTAVVDDVLGVTTVHVTGGGVRGIFIFELSLKANDTSSMNVHTT